MKRALASASALAALLAACGTHDSRETLGDKLQGNWACHRAFPDQGFRRSEDAVMEAIQTSLKYRYYIAWECDSAGPPCPGEPPTATGGYFEGLFQDLGDSLVLKDGIDTVSFRDVTDTSFTLSVNRWSFPMLRN